jgi:osmotically-inducible protein OsmY
MGERRRETDSRGGPEASRDEDARSDDRGYGYGGAPRGFGYGGHGPDREAAGRAAGSVYEPGRLAGYGRGGEPAEGGIDSVQAAGRWAEDERGFPDRAGDETAGLPGDAQARSRQDEGSHRGRGPRGWRRPDGRILDDLCDRLAEDPRLDASGVEVRVEDGAVTLSGQVEDRASKRRAEECAYLVSGVRGVRNDLREPGATQSRPAADAERA